MYFKLALLAKKYWKQLSVAAVIIGLFLLMLPIILITSFMPEAEDDDIQKYVEVGNELLISWKELVAFDMVKYNNDLKGRDPNDSAYYFISLHYEEFEPAKTECAKYEGKECIETVQVPEKVTVSRDIQGKESIVSFFRRLGLFKNDIAQNINTINSMPGKRVYVTSRPVNEAMDAAGFSKDEKQRYHDIIEMGIIDELYGQYADIGLLPGTCVNNISPDGKAIVNAKVEGYTETISKYAKKYGVEPYVEIIKAMMMAESNGKGNDPMQASESSFADISPSCRGKSGGARIGCIKDPETSINAGVQEFKETIQLADYDIAIALQSYNFGKYFATWIKSNGGKYTVEIAQHYSNTVMAAAGQGLGTPTHAHKILTQYYRDPGCVAGNVSPEVVGSNGWVWPTKSTRITDVFHTIRSNGQHNAVDVGAIKAGVAGDPIWSMADGAVIYSGLITGGGNSVFVDHGNGVVSRYIHMQSRSVKTGQKVKAGDIVGTMGGTGGTRTQLVQNAYAVHLDFQIKINGTPVDPLIYFPSIR